VAFLDSVVPTKEKGSAFWGLANGRRLQLHCYVFTASKGVFYHKLLSLQSLNSRDFGTLQRDWEKGRCKWP